MIIKKIIFILLLVVASNSYGQCKFKIDRITKKGDTIISTKDITIYSDGDGSYTITFTKKNSDYFIAFRKAYNSKEVIMVRKNMTLTLTNSNGENISLVAQEEYSTNELYSAGESSVIIARYPIDKSKLKMIAEYSIKECSFQTAKKTWTFSPKNKKKIIRLQEGVTCIINR